MLFRSFYFARGWIAHFIERSPVRSDAAVVYLIQAGIGFLPPDGAVEVGYGSMLFYQHPQPYSARFKDRFHAKD